MINKTYRTPFNGAVEIGLRALSVLNEAYPTTYSLQRLVIFDYLTVHSDDYPGGPKGLHPKTPHRNGELLVRREMLQNGLILYNSRGLIEQHFDKNGVFYSATEHSANFLDSLTSDYIDDLRNISRWIVDKLGHITDIELESQIKSYLGTWGAEFTMESVLWTEELS